MFRLRRGARRCSWRRSTRCWPRLPRQIERYADSVCMGYTHLQPAEPTTVGYRLAVYAQDLLIDRAALRVRAHATHRQGHSRRGRHVGFVRAAARRRHAQHAKIRSRRARRPSSSKRATSRPKRIRANSTTCCCRSWPASARRFRSSRPTCASRARPASARCSSRSAPSKSAVRRCRSSAIPVMSERIDSLARLLPAYADVDVAERGDELPRTHARRQRQPPHDASRSAAVRRRDPLARAQGHRRFAHRRTPDRAKTCAPTGRLRAPKRC